MAASQGVKKAVVAFSGHGNEISSCCASSLENDLTDVALL